jgi:hypothetical protein
LAATAMFKQTRKRWYLRYARRIARQIEAFVKEGAMNCVHMHLLLQVEMMTCKKVRRSALAHSQTELRRAFDRAISSAARSGFCHDAGLANERAAMYHSDFDAEYAKVYWHEAFQRYVDWGAGRKLEQMTELHPCLRKKGRKSTTNSVESGHMNARSRYKEDVANQHRSLRW